uniref:Uncharacterized protein n=1 Tax=Meloidogyne hapla TaxID=6305 RepID=A0A1I8BNX9_MELHA
MDLTLNLIYIKNTNPFDDETIQPDSILTENLLKPFVRKLPIEQEYYEDLFEKLKVFWSDIAGMEHEKTEDVDEENNTNLNVEKKDFEMPLIDFESSSEAGSSNKFMPEVDIGRNLESLIYG